MVERLGNITPMTNVLKNIRPCHIKAIYSNYSIVASEQIYSLCELFSIMISGLKNNSWKHNPILSPSILNRLGSTQEDYLSLFHERVYFEDFNIVKQFQMAACSYIPLVMLCVITSDKRIIKIILKTTNKEYYNLQT